MSQTLLDTDVSQIYTVLPCHIFSEGTVTDEKHLSIKGVFS